MKRWDGDGVNRRRRRDEFFSSVCYASEPPHGEKGVDVWVSSTDECIATCGCGHLDAEISLHLEHSGCRHSVMLMRHDIGAGPVGVERLCSGFTSYET